MSDTNLNHAVFGGGCFWCTEAVFEELRGVVSVMPGYAGGPSPRNGFGHASGTKANPTYEDVCTGTTGYAEVINIEYNAHEISYHDLLTVFFATHDPTAMNRQGNDVGTQYRSVIFYADDAEKREAEDFIKSVNASTLEGKPIVTAIEPLANFYEAEEYHRQYYRNNPSQAYCQIVINPKLKKLEEKFAELLKSHSKL